MKIVKILGGLGNQMFQYAFYKSLTKNFGEVKADLSEFSRYSLHNNYELARVFDLQVQTSSYYENLFIGGQNRDFLSRTLKKITGVRKTYYEQPNASSFDASLYYDTKNCYLDGYWQNEHYFSKIKSQIKSDFSFKLLKDRDNLTISELINCSFSVGIHVRRGDYVNHSYLGNICTLEYYQKSIEYFTNKYENVHFFIFSNDILWCRNNLLIKTAKTYVDINFGKDNFKDMQLMTLCKHIIIANSSFSWWAAYLNSNQHAEVIAPYYWFTPLNKNSLEVSNQLIPASWRRI
jgi:hypothetical protein